MQSCVVFQNSRNNTTKGPDSQIFFETHLHCVVKLMQGLFSTLIPREARAEGPSVARLKNLSGQARPSGAKPREFERKIYLYTCMYVCLYIYLVEGVRNVA